MKFCICIVIGFFLVFQFKNDTMTRLPGSIVTGSSMDKPKTISCLLPDLESLRGVFAADSLIETLVIEVFTAWCH